ncbi:MAG: GNAT family N-acetyltransferase [Aquincola tertiaricarbonis]|jgi:predicted GNAT family acetyltransferase|uniref:GNAT family N-acetyltransferase n=1 Tax=Aquabacterium fontiphilum TaxID=450365 RepID=UPI00137822C2|nr:GNAT family N-acetyltransferase [Aquabacterium fontiphilum]NBD21804.1 N-acetyltransferase [Aquabacterium fontiphilum]
MSTDIQIQHRPEIGRFEAIVDGLRCEADYQLDGTTMLMTHTGVPRELEGRGIAAQLVKAALAWAREQGLRVRPLCSYVDAYMRRHTEWQDLRA